MTTPPPYTITHESVTVILDGQTHTVRSGEKHFKAVRDAILAESWDAIPEMLVPGIAVEDWITQASPDGGFSYNRKDLCLYYQQERLPESLSRRIVGMFEAGSDASFLMRFWERLQRNPSYRSVQQLYGFLQNEGIPIDKNGYILAYKSVRLDYKDWHSGTCDNRPGVENSMPRNKISDDPKVACHEGYHVGALSYAKGFHSGGHLVVCRVDPEHVVCVPYDSSQRKVRVCKYTVVGMHGDVLPDLVVDDIEVDTPSEPTAPRVPAKKTDKTAAKPKAPAAPAPVPGDDELTPAREANVWDYLIDTPDEELHDQNLQHLRKYARHELMIVRASKLPGGKPTLVAKIIEVRRTPVDTEGK